MEIEKDPDYDKKNHKNKNDLNSEEEEEIYDLIKSSALLKGLEYNERIIESLAGWKFPEKYNKLTSEQIKEIRKTYKIDIDGEDVPPPINNFKSMKFSKAILNALNKKKIEYPTPIQMQGLPVM